MSINIENVLSRAPWLGLLLLGCSLVEAVRVLRLKKRGVVTEGIVTSIDSVESGDTPIVTFKDQNGIEHEVRVKTLLGEENWSIGTPWPVRYDPHNPKRAQIDRPAQQWGGAVFLLGVALILFAVKSVELFLSLTRS